jgi:hypothetical protein
MTKHEAIYALYPNVAVIRGDEAFDEQGNTVAYDEQVVSDKVASMAYISKRAAEYPNFLDYLDGIVKGDQLQIQAYIDACIAVKTKYPKEI